VNQAPENARVLKIECRVADRFRSGTAVLAAGGGQPNVRFSSDTDASLHCGELTKSGRTSHSAIHFCLGTAGLRGDAHHSQLRSRLAAASRIGHFSSKRRIGLRRRVAPNTSQPAAPPARRLSRLLPCRKNTPVPRPKHWPSAGLKSRRNPFPMGPLPHRAAFQQSIFRFISDLPTRSYQQIARTPAGVEQQIQEMEERHVQVTSALAALCARRHFRTCRELAPFEGESIELGGVRASLTTRITERLQGR